GNTITAHTGIVVDAVTIAAVHGVAIGGKPPVLPEVGSEHSIHVVHLEAGRRRRIRALHVCCAGIRSELAIGQKLLQRRISLKMTDEILHGDATGVLAVDNGDSFAVILLLAAQTAMDGATVRE